MAGRLADLGHRGVTAATFHAAALRQLRHFWPRVHGTDAPEILASKAPILAPLAANLPGGYRYLAVRDLAAEIEWAKARRIPGRCLRGSCRRDRPGRSPPRRPHGRPVPPLRGRQTACRPDRLRGHARADDRAHRVEHDGRRRSPGSLPLVLGRRIPGHEPAPAGAPRRLAWRPGRPRGRRRRGPDDLHVHGGDERLPRPVQRAIPGRPNRPARAQLPLDARSARLRQPSARGGPVGSRRARARRAATAAETSCGHPARRAGSKGPRVPDGRCRGRRDRDRGPGPGPRRGRPRCDGDPGPDECPAPRVRGRARRSRHRVPRPRRAVLRAP